MSDGHVRKVAYPGLRSDIIAGLDLLTTLTAEAVVQQPGALTAAVHWLVDDTFWDSRDPVDSIGHTLRDEHEATAVKALLEPLLHVLVHLGPTEADIDYLNHPCWPEVVTGAEAAHRLLTSNDMRTG